MKKFFVTAFFLTFCFVSISAQSDDFSDEDFFSSDDSLFSDDVFSEDSLFADGDGIDEVNEVSAKTDLSKGILFEDGSIKIGGNFTTSLETKTVLYSEEDKSFGENLKASVLTPTANANLIVDARPTQSLRMYTKFGIQYPYTVKGNLQNKNFFDQTVSLNTQVTISDWFSLKELFTDFSIADTAFFRFGLHTVTWGTGYFFSPVSDLINTSSIDPENTSAQVDGSLNLRTQIVLPNTQNCLWFYVIPSTDFVAGTTADTYLRDTALAAKADLVFGNWEFGIGGFYKYQNSPKAMLTASGSLKNVSVFGEFVYRYGADSEWLAKKDVWSDKTNIFQATVGLSRYWKNPAITLAAQYYYDGNNKDMTHQYLTYGHNVAALLSFGKILGNSDFTSTIFGMVNFGKEDLPPSLSAMLPQTYASLINTMTLSAMINYSPLSTIKIGMGPYITWKSFDNNPTVSLKLSASLGGGKF